MSRAFPVVERWAAAWAERRHGRDPASVRLARRRIYILPTRFGALFGCLVFAMLLGSLNYGASLAFALTFLLASLTLVAMHHCHNNLLGIRVALEGTPRAVFVGEPAEFRIALGNEAGTPRYELELVQDGAVAGPIDLAAGTHDALTLVRPTTRRGWVALGRFTVRTYHPARLFRAWSSIHMSAACLVYPLPAPPGRPLLASPAAESLGTGGRLPGDEDFAGLRAAVAGDPPRRIAWKAYARSDQLLSKQFAAAEQSSHWLTWDALPELGAEQRIAQLARWCLDAEQAGRRYGLEIPGAVVELGTGKAQLERCLRALALVHAPP